MMLEIELPLLRGLDLAYVPKIKQLLLIISESVPFIPNVTKLSQKMGIARSTLLLYFHYLAEIYSLQSICLKSREVLVSSRSRLKCIWKIQI